MNTIYEALSDPRLLIVVFLTISLVATAAYLALVAVDFFTHRFGEAMLPEEDE